jgi:hypothetical protein
MNTTKTLMLAALTALSLGTGTAMAQSEIPSAPEATYFSGQRQAVPRTVNPGQLQSGSSDVEPARFGVGNQAPPLPAYDYGTLANPG